MSVLGTIKDVLRASSQSANRGDVTEERSEGSYWCTDCGERVRDVDVAGADPPTCPSCGDEMDFERSAASTGCAC